MHVSRRMPGLVTFFIASVWAINGVVKISDLVPRHRLIVSRILPEVYAPVFTVLIGCLELLMMIWILSGIRSRWCMYIQVIVVAMMNVLEIITVPDLLLFGYGNAAVAAFFIGVVIINEMPFQNHRAKRAHT